MQEQGGKPGVAEDRAGAPTPRDIHTGEARWLELHSAGAAMRGRNREKRRRKQTRGKEGGREVGKGRVRMRPGGEGFRSASGLCGPDGAGRGTWSLGARAMPLSLSARAAPCQPSQRAPTHRPHGPLPLLCASPGARPPLPAFPLPPSGVGRAACGVLLRYAAAPAFHSTGRAPPRPLMAISGLILLQ